MSGVKYVVLLAALILGPAICRASEEGSVPLKNLPVREKLESRMDVNFQGTTLNELLQFFRQRLEINVVLDRAASDLSEKPITLQLKDVRAQDALAWSLRQVGLRYALVSGIVLVGDRQYINAMEPTTLRQYDVADLLMPPP
ncbi:MAG: hypothetical protein ACLQVA_03920 [Candidatus Brocadiia bacterium]